MAAEETTSPSPSRSSRREALRSVAQSLFVNALCPYLLYRWLEPHCPAGSVIPLLYATIFPVVGILLGLLRNRRVDGIALLALLGIVIHVAVTLLIGNVATALVVRSFDGALIGLVLVISALIGRPIILYVARQAAARSAGAGARADALMGEEGRRLFRPITLVWGILLVAMSAVHVLLALKLPPAEFLLVSPVLGLATIVALMLWTGTYLSLKRRQSARQH